MRGKTLAFGKRIAIIFCDLEASLGARACVQVLCVQKTRRFAFAFLSPLSSCPFSKKGQQLTEDDKRILGEQMLERAVEEERQVSERLYISRTLKTLIFHSFPKGPGRHLDVSRQKLTPRCLLSGPVLRDAARLSQRYPPIARYGVFGVSTWPIGCDTPSPFSERFPIGEHAKWRCDSPPQKGYLSDTCAIPYENKANGCDTPLCDTISKRYCAIWGGISHWAAKAVSRQFLTHNYPHANYLLKCRQKCLSPTRERFFCLFQNCPRGKVIVQ